jgi:hypothetical protein
MVWFLDVSLNSAQVQMPPNTRVLHAVTERAIPYAAPVPKRVSRGGILNRGYRELGIIALMCIVESDVVV